MLARVAPLLGCFGEERTTGVSLLFARSDGVRKTGRRERERGDRRKEAIYKRLQNKKEAKSSCEVVPLQTRVALCDFHQGR